MLHLMELVMTVLLIACLVASSLLLVGLIVVSAMLAVVGVKKLWARLPGGKE